MIKKTWLIIMPLMLLCTACKKNDSIDVGLFLTPALISPENGVVITENPPTLTWEKIYGRNGYEVQLDDDDSFSDVLLTIATSIDHETSTMSLTLSFPLSPGIYFWRVRWSDCVGGT